MTKRRNTVRRPAQRSGKGRNKPGQAMKYVLAACVLVGLFVQITLLAQISGQAKAISKVNGQIRELRSAEENLEVCLSMYQNLDRIESRATALGMRLPDETQIRVLSMPGYGEETFTQTAENTAAETSMR